MKILWHQDYYIKKNSVLINHSHLYITCNTEPRLKADEGLLRRELLVET